LKVLGSFLLLSLLLLVALNCNASAADRSAPAKDKEEEAPPVASGGPARIRLEVRETAGIGRQGEVLRSGLPLPRSLAARDPKRLAVVDAKGALVPAQFEVLARWNTGLSDVEAPIQWLLVLFPASVEPGGKAAYWLVTDGSAGTNPPPSRPLKVVREGQGVAVDTGAAVFHIGETDGLFSAIHLAGGRRLVTGGEMSVQTGGRSVGHAAVRKMWIEHSGPLSATVVVDGSYALPPVGDGGLGSRRRYVFTAGSPTVLVRHAVAWEGNLGCQGCIRTKDGQPNAIRFERVRDTLGLDLDALGGASAVSVSVTAVGAFGKPALEGLGNVGGGDIARVRQALRSRRHDPLAFEVDVAGKQARGERADGGMLAAGGPGGAVAIALNHMHRYEPQALRLLGNGRTVRLAIDVADDKVWLAHHQGLFASMAVSALPAVPERADLDRLVWAPLNRPLRAWPDAAWFAGSQAVEEIPAGPLPRAVAAYDRVIPEVLKLTEERIDTEGLPGLMTFGVYPRYWGKWDGGELQCKKDKKNQKKGDPTPDETWDDTFWCGAWTDYHNTVATAPLWAMRSGEVEWLDDLAFPGALRTLHTQVMQCGPDERWFYCGQAPAGYAAYRSDFNSSHAYFDNLYMYYWLTGDGTVVDTLRRGGENMRRLMCPQRGGQPVTAAVNGPEGAACAAGEPLSKSSFSGRVGIQWLSAFRFLGLASPDSSFLEDYKSGLGRLLTHQYAELQRDGKIYGFLGGVVDAKGAGGRQERADDEEDPEDREQGKKGKGGKKGERRKPGPGQYEAGPLWMNAFYDAELLERWMQDSGDQPLGDPPLRPSRVLAAVARTLVDLDARYHDKKGAVRSPWPQHLLYSFEGPRIGGRLLEVESDGRELFNPEKAGMAALLVRVGQRTGDREILRAGEEMVEYILDASKGEDVPLGKLQGQYLARLHGAVGRLAAPSPSLPRGAGEGAPAPQTP
jgi:hypothetical protein